MKKIILFFCTLVSTHQALAGGAATGGASEWTQILNNVQLVQSFTSQTATELQTLEQYQLMVTNAIKNPASLLPSEAQQLAHNIGAVMDSEKQITGSVAQVDQRFANTFSNPTAANFATNFKNLSNTTSNSMQTAMETVGMVHAADASAADTVSALYQKIRASQGSQAALETIGEINVEQIQHSRKIETLLETQVNADAAAVAAKTAKDTDAGNHKINIFGTTPMPMPTAPIGGL